MKTTIDFSQIRSASAIPPADYTVVIDSVILRESQKSEHPYLEWSLVVSDGECQGTELKTITSFSPKALWKLQEIFNTFGVEATGELALEIDDATGLMTSPPLAGEAAVATVFNEEYEGRLQNRVSNLRGLREPATATSPPSGAATQRPSPFNKQGGERKVFK